MFTAFEIDVGNPLRKLVLLKLCDNANDNGECWPSIATIARKCEMSVRSVQTHIRALEKMGMVRRTERKDGSINETNMYLITLKKSEIHTPGAGDAPLPAGDAPTPCSKCTRGVQEMHTESPNKPTNEPEDIYPARELDEFRPGNDHATIAAAKGLDVLAELERFRHYKKSKGAQSADWSSDFALWLIDTKPRTVQRDGIDFSGRDYDEIPPGFRG